MPLEDDDELAKKLARLSHSRRQDYNAKLFATYSDDREPDPRFAHRLADTYLKNLSPKAEASDVGELMRKERNRVEEKGRAENFAANRASSAPSHSSKVPEPSQLSDPNTKQAPPQRVAATSPSPPTDIRANMPLREELSPERLRAMLGRYEELAKLHDVKRDPQQQQEMRKLAEQQKIDQHALEGDKPRLLAQEQRQHDLIVHQQLAQYVSVEGKWMSRHLQQKDPAESARCREESRQTEKLAQQLGYEIAVLREGKLTAREITQRQQQDAQSKAQDASRGAGTLTDGERVAAPADAKAQIVRRERSDAARRPKLSRGDEFAISVSKENAVRSRNKGRER